MKFRIVNSAGCYGIGAGIRLSEYVPRWEVRIMFLSLNLHIYEFNKCRFFENVEKNKKGV